jgi:uridine kinase
MNREQAISKLADLIAEIHRDHPVRVGIDGVDCAGKTMLANEIKQFLDTHSRKVIRASIDGFHNTRVVRHGRGRFSPIGYYHDSFDLNALISCLLLPLGPGGDRKYKTAFFDYATDRPLNNVLQTAEEASILIFDGIFLLREELASYWDFTVFVEASPRVTIGRALLRDRHLFDNSQRIREVYYKRYIPGQKLYLEQVRPSERANVVFRNDDISAPHLTIRTVPSKRDAR